MTRPITFSLLLAAVISLGACGQKGPLYLPDDQPAPPASETTGE